MKFFTLFSYKRMVRTKATCLVAIFGLALVFAVSNARAQAITEDFANITTLPAAGWFTQNNSTPNGSTAWFQGNTAVFPAQAGAANSYIGANFNATTGTNTISLWLLTPNRTFNNGDVIKFWTRGPTASAFPDRLEVRLSTAGASTNVGTGSTAVGDFTTLLTSVNPNLEVGGYPETWTEFTLTLSGLPGGGASGRVAFRYFVTMGGPTGDNSNFIGIDTFSYTPGAPPAAADGPVDYNGDGRSDYVVVRNTGGGAGGQITWFYNLSSGGATVAKEWGLSTDFFISGNWDTDMNDDIAVWRSGAAGTAAFYILRSSDQTALVEPFGQTGDDPTVVADYTGDGRTDFAVYRGGATAGAQSTWYYRSAATPGGAVNFVPWGQNGDFPAPGDYDGDGSADFVIQRNNGGGQAAFWRNLTTDADDVVVFGTPTDVIVPGDWDGDGKTDIAVIRGSGGLINWFYEPSGTAGVQVVQFVHGNSATDFPTQGDYDGDGRTDAAIWRPSVTAGMSAFWTRESDSGTVGAFPLGSNGDYPVANFNSH